MEFMFRIALIVTLGALVIVGLFFLMMMLRRQTSSMSTESQLKVADARIDAYERPASLVAEQIEEVVRRKLREYPDLADAVLDFGTMPDGTIDIWINSKQYDNLEDIPDERIREAIQAAVSEFNQ